MIKELSKSEIFKLKHGYSLTLYKLMKKYNCSSFEEYKVLRNNKKRQRVLELRAKKPVKTKVESPVPQKKKNK